MDEDSTLIFTNGQITGNTDASDGGGIYSFGGLATLVNSTVSGNTATNDGGGIYVYNGSFNLHNVTIANNTADSDGNDNGDGGGINIDGSSIVTATHSIIGGNVDNSPTGSQHPDCSGMLTNPSYNLIGLTTGCSVSGTALDNIINASPNLGPLQDNGGNMLTHALLAGSPAIDAGDPAGCLDQNGLPLTTDQRNFIRPADGGSGSARCDMGAFEYASPGPAFPDGTVVYLPLIQK
jgi:predicted outer membrane repeat protein